MVFFILSILTFSSLNLYMVIKKKYSKIFFIINISLSIWILCMAVFINQDLHSLSRIMYCVNLSIYMVLKVFTFNSNTEEIMKYYINFGEYAKLVELYVQVLFILATIMTFTIILDIFSNYYMDKKIKYYPYKTRHIFYNSNSSHINASYDIAKKYKGKIIFSSTNEGSHKIPNGSLITKNDIIETFNKINKYSEENRFYILEDSLQATMAAVELINIYGNKETKDKLFVQDNKHIIRMYIEERMLDDKQFKIRIINKEKDTLYNYFYQNTATLFYALQKNVIIIGDDEKSLEVLKIILWLNQILNNEICINYVYKEEATEKKIKELMPGIFEKGGYEFNYKIMFFRVSSFESEYLSRVIHEFNDTATIFWSLDSEIENIKLSYCISNNEKLLFKFVLVENLINECIIANNENIRIIDFGKINLHLESELEKKALCLHKRYSELSVEKNFFNSEYNYYSSLARAIAARFEEEYFKENESIFDRRKVEHNRWSIFLKTEGWTLGNKIENNKKVHNLLVAFELLDDMEKDKDS